MTFIGMALVTGQAHALAFVEQSTDQLVEHVYDRPVGVEVVRKEA